MYEQCLSDLTESIELDPNNKTAYANRAVVYLKKGEYEKASKDYEDNVRIDPNDPQMWYECGMMQRTLKHYGSAVKSLDNALKLNPNLGLAYLERARAKAGSGDISEAKSDYQKAQQFGVSLGPADQQLIRRQGN
jgi:tetratricopeptide (TPR) repeat protein